MSFYKRKYLLSDNLQELVFLPCSKQISTQLKHLERSSNSILLRDLTNDELWLRQSKTEISGSAGIGCIKL